MISVPSQGVHDMTLSPAEVRCAECGGLPTSWKCDPIMQGTPPYYAASCLDAGCGSQVIRFGGTRQEALRRWKLSQEGQ
jgi:hypothetical protein